MTNAEPEPDTQVRAKVERAWEAFLDGLAAAVVEGLIAADRRPPTADRRPVMLLTAPARVTTSRANDDGVVRRRQPDS